MSYYSLLGYALALALLAVTWAVILVDAGMLLAPVQRWAREWHQRQWISRAERRCAMNTEIPTNELPSLQAHEMAYSAHHRLDEQWWAKPLWLCYRCVAGQAGLWGYLLLIWRHHAAYFLFQHLVFTALTLFLACILNRIYQWSQN